MSTLPGGAPPPPPAPPQEEPVRIRRGEFSDIEQLSAATRQATIETQLARGGRYRGGVLDVETDGLGIQWGFHGAPVVTSGEVWAEGAFLATWGGAPARANGHDLGPSSFVYYAPGAEHQARTEGALSWVSIRVAGLERLAAILAPELRLGQAPPARLVESTPRAIEARRVLSDVRAAAESGAAALQDPAAARAIREIVGASLVRMMAAVRTPRAHENLAASSALVRKAAAYLRARGFQPVYLPELCAAVGASEARLRDAFLRVYRIGPARYLRIRRLHLVRRALRSTRREELTVSAAASSAGFFQLGRFAGDYRAFFGELPSRTKRAR